MEEPRVAGDLDGVRGVEAGAERVHVGFGEEGGGKEIECELLLPWIYSDGNDRQQRDSFRAGRRRSRRQPRPASSREVAKWEILYGFWTF